MLYLKTKENIKHSKGGEKREFKARKKSSFTAQ
jgi:hypothetical protein